MMRSAHPSSDSLLKHSVLMIASGTAVCATGSLMAKPVRMELGYSVAGAFIAACLLIALASFGIRHKKAIPVGVLAAYIAMGALMVSYTAFSAIYLGWPETSVVGLFAGLLAMLWAAWFVTVAFNFPPRSPQGIGLCALAAANSSFGLILCTRTGLTRFSVVTAAGCYTILLGVQVYMAAVLLHRELARERAFDRQ